MKTRISSWAWPIVVLLGEALDNQAELVMCVRSDPLGDRTPRLEDIHVAQRLNRALDFLNIELMDYLIVGESITSLRERHVIQGAPECCGKELGAMARIWHSGQVSQTVFVYDEVGHVLRGAPSQAGDLIAGGILGGTWFHVPLMFWQPGLLRHFRQSGLKKSICELGFRACTSATALSVGLALARPLINVDV